MERHSSMPILFENYEIVVFENGSGEIFVETKDEPQVRARITPRRDSLVITAGNGGGILTPTSVNGLPAFVVRHP